MLKKFLNKNQKFQDKNEEKKFKDKFSYQYTKEYIDQRVEDFKNWKFYKKLILNDFGLKQSDVVLDAGCSLGTYEILLERGNFSTKNLIGVDISEKSIETINGLKKNFGIKGKFRVDDLESLSFKGKTFDKILCLNTIHHFPKKSLENVIKEFYRVLKVGGKVLIVDPNIFNILILKSHIFESWSKNEFPYSPFTLEKEFKKVFDQVEMKTFRFIPRKDLHHIFEKIPIVKHFGKSVIIIATKTS